MDFDPSWFGYDTAEARDDEILIFGDREPPPSGIESSLDMAWTDDLEWSNPIIGPAVRRADRVYPHLWTLMSMTERERREAVGRLPYQDLLLADLLVHESAARASRRPETSEAMALAAEWIADQPWPGVSTLARRIQALALIHQGDARRRLGEGWSAELRLAAAFSILQELPASDAHPAFCEALATLREEHGRLEEATALLWQAAILEARLRRGRIGDSFLVRLGFLYLKQADPARAMALFTDVHARMEASILAGCLGPKVDLGRALCLAAAGLAGPARQMLEQSRPSRRLLRDRNLRLPLEWLECRIAVHLGDLDRAIPRLEAVRRWLLDSFRFDDVCLCTLDLAFAYAQRGEALLHLPRLLAGVAGLPWAEERPWVLEALGRFGEGLERDIGEPVIAAREAAEIARRGRSPLGPGDASGPAASLPIHLS